MIGLNVAPCLPQGTHDYYNCGEMQRLNFCERCRIVVALAVGLPIKQVQYVNFNSVWRSAKTLSVALCLLY